MNADRKQTEHDDVKIVRSGAEHVCAINGCYETIKRGEKHYRVHNVRHRIVEVRLHILCGVKHGWRESK